MKFNNKSKYELLVVKINNEEEIILIQKLVFKYGFKWFISKDIIYDIDDMKYFYLLLNTHNMLFENFELDNDFINSYKHFQINNINELKNFLKMGNIKPTYFPKKILK